jgi:hypothetical protein
MAAFAARWDPYSTKLQISLAAEEYIKYMDNYGYMV